MSKSYCKIVDVKPAWSSTGDEIYLLTHECGEVERRIRRKRNTRITKPAPTRVACERQPAALAAEGETND